MIHYTLLPKHDIDVLKKEYRIRVFTLLMFFVSCSIVVGIVALIPAYMYSYNQERDSLKKLSQTQKSNESKGIYEVIKNLETAEKMVAKLKEDSPIIETSSILDTVLLHGNGLVNINVFQMNITKSASSSAEIVIQGKSKTRESLLTFKKDLEQDKMFYDIEMPISDLAKTIDSTYAIKFKLKKQNAIKL